MNLIHLLSVVMSKSDNSGGGGDIMASIISKGYFHMFKGVYLFFGGNCFTDKPIGPNQFMISCLECISKYMRLTLTPSLGLYNTQFGCFGHQTEKRHILRKSPFGKKHVCETKEGILYVTFKWFLLFLYHNIMFHFKTRL